jgi:hypothetical protein
MISHHIHAASARERQHILLAEAEAARQARQARLHRPRAGASVDRLPQHGARAASAPVRAGSAPARRAR